MASPRTLARSRTDEPVVLDRHALGEAEVMAGRWKTLRVPFVGAEAGALLITRCSRNGMEINAEHGILCAEVSGDRSDRGGHYVSDRRIGISQHCEAGPAGACCGQHTAFRHILTIPRGLAAVLDISQEEGMFGRASFMFDVVDEADCRMRIFNRHAYESRLRREKRRPGEHSNQAEAKHG